MRAGNRLIGSILKRGFPFSLEFLNGSEDVEFSVVTELINSGYIIAVEACGPDHAEYRLRRPPDTR